MRIAMFTDCYHPVINGVVTSISLLKQALEADGHEVLLFTHDFPGYVDQEPNVFRFRSVNFPLMKENRFTFPWPLTPVARLARRRVDAIHVHTPFNVGALGMAAGAWLGRPRFFTHHTLWEEYTHYVPLPQWFMKPVAVWLCRAFCQAGKAVISPSEQVKQRLREQGVTRPIHVIPTGIQTSAFRGGDPTGPTEELDLRPGQKLFLYIGRLAKEKSIDFLLETLAMNPGDEVRLAVIGDGPSRGDLQDRAHQLGLDGRVRFLGYRPRTDLRHYLACARGLVFASQTETQGLVLLEAQAAGVPVVAVRGPGVTEAVENGGSGVLIEPGDHQAFLATWQRVAEDDAFRNRLGARARDWAEGFSSQAMARQMTALYGSFTGPRPPPENPTV